jgi:aspartate/methionine/tyrosine aminotransferase
MPKPTWQQRWKLFYAEPIDMETPFLPQNPWLKQSKLRQIFESAPQEAINLGLGQPGEDTPEFIREAGARAMREAPLGYTLNAGIVPLREKLAAEFNNSSITAKNICLTAGVQEALFAFFYTIASPGKKILLPDPGFLTYPALVRLGGMEPVFYELSKDSNFRLDADAVLNAITPEVTAVLIAHPSNPSGSNATKVEMDKLISGLSALNHPVWLVSDEVYFGMSTDDCVSADRYLNQYPWIVVMRGASKTHNMTGWRLGWAVLPEMLIKPYVAAHQYVCTCVAASTQWAFNMLRGTEEERQWLSQQRALYARKRAMVFEALDSVRPLYGGEGAFYVMLELSDADLKNGNDEAWVMEVMQRALVTTTPGSAFGKMSDGMIRISCGPKIASLAIGLERLRRQLIG